MLGLDGPRRLARGRARTPTSSSSTATRSSVYTRVAARPGSRAQKVFDRGDPRRPPVRRSAATAPATSADAVPVLRRRGPRPDGRGRTVSARRRVAPDARDAALAVAAAVLAPLAVAGRRAGRRARRDGPHDGRARRSRTAVVIVPRRQDRRRSARGVDAGARRATGRSRRRSSRPAWSTRTASSGSPGCSTSRTTRTSSSARPRSSRSCGRSTPTTPHEPLVAWLRGFGVTTMHTGHAPGALGLGPDDDRQDRAARTVDAALVPSRSARSPSRSGPSALARAKASRPARARKEVAMLRAELIKAREYRAKRGGAAADGKPARDLRARGAGPRARRRDAAAGHRAARRRTSLTALRLAEEFGIRVCSTAPRRRTSARPRSRPPACR